MLFDCRVAYVGSANLTGAGMDMKSENTQNFEAMNLFDSMWNGSRCKSCRRKALQRPPHLKTVIPPRAPQRAKC